MSYDEFVTLAQIAMTLACCLVGVVAVCYEYAGE